MWLADASRCPACAHKATCPDRKKIISTLSALTNELNTDPAFADDVSPADGNIIVNCMGFAQAPLG